MNIRVATARFAGELTEDANGSLSITVTPQGLYAASFAQLATETYLDTCETLLKLWSEERSTSGSRQRFRC